MVAGLIELYPDDVVRLPAAVRERRERDARRRLSDVTGRDPGAEHHHFAGASLGVTAEIYRRVGGLDGCAALEDQAFGAKLARHGIPVVRAADVRVRTSARTDGRARRGLSVDLAVSMWREQRRYRAEAFTLDGLRAAKQTTTVSVVLPAKECADTVAGVLETTVAPAAGGGAGRRGHRHRRRVARRHRGARRGTWARSSCSRTSCCPSTGRHWARATPCGGRCPTAAAMSSASWTPTPRIPILTTSSGSSGPLLDDPQVALVKGAFDRPFRPGGQTLAHEGGRVTEVMARPLLNLHFPLLAGLHPAAGGRVRRPARPA